MIPTDELDRLRAVAEGRPLCAFHPATVLRLLGEVERLEAQGLLDVDAVMARWELAAEEAAKAEGEVAVLREALLGCSAGSPQGNEVQADARHIGQAHGYGAMMHALAAEWRGHLRATGAPASGGFTVGPCRGAVDQALSDTAATAEAHDARVRRAGLEQAARELPAGLNSWHKFRAWLLERAADQ